jgi:hypothetical protein
MKTLAVGIASCGDMKARTLKTMQRYGPVALDRGAGRLSGVRCFRLSSPL